MAESGEGSQLKPTEQSSLPRPIPGYEDFAIDFPRTCPAEYFALLASIEEDPKNAAGATANAIRGFHFAGRPLLDVVKPADDTLFYFPIKPNPSQLRSIGRAVAYAPGWGVRPFDSNQSYPMDWGLEDLRMAYCYEIIPDDQTTPKKVKVEVSGYFGDNPLLGLKVTTEKDSKWKIVAGIAIPL